MPKDKEEILKLINELRQKLHSTGGSKTLTDPEVIKASQELNKVLNEYYRLLNNKNAQ
ncbi:aspartyl-phosphate phosphatase Spo0E family protein [Desulforamulus reducens]|uniref:aspartyl-phosphate phosphatase Spo0E family protein n=1 Tax=Desulforamulus reducens TaxID=59610 RepID=UPI0002E400B4|nr:aspartyl-phosphate phosphatase Spo0E family protein [Desulforamulus reducens]